MKIASTKVEMFPNTLFSYYHCNLHHSCIKNPISNIELSFHQQIFKSQVAFYFIVAFFSYFFFQKRSLYQFKAFLRQQIQFKQYKFPIYRCRFNFHVISLSSTNVDLISNCFMGHLRVNYKKQPSFIYKLTFVRLFKII